jgi:endo-1,4-beta-xylanase
MPVILTRQAVVTDTEWTGSIKIFITGQSARFSATAFPPKAVRVTRESVAKRMSYPNFGRAFLFLWLLAVTAKAQTNLLPAGGAVAMTLLRPDASYATRTVVSVSGQPFTQAIRINTLRLAGNRWDIQLNIPVTNAVAVDDVITGEVWLRRSGGTNAAASAEGVFERAGDPYTQSLTRVWLVTSTNWTRFRFAFRCVESYTGAAGNRAQFNIRLGFAPQQVDIGGLTLVNQGRGRPVTDFPNDFNYAGRELDAPWRAPAALRIEQYRKADYRVEVRDQAGYPVPGARVSARLRRHAFGWGSAVDGNRLVGTLGTAADRARYQAVVTNWFNKVVLENDLKWPQYESSSAPNRRTGTNALNWLDARGIACRGHNLIWPGTAYLPSRVNSAIAAGDTNLVRRYIDEHFTNILTTLRGRLVDWDVMNEVTHVTDVQRLLGDREMVRWFQMARSLDPAAKLFVNEYENLEVAGTGSLAPQRLFDVVRYFQTNGAPVDGVGLQGHIGGYLPDPALLYEQLDYFATLGLPLQVTEFDVNIADEQTQADYVRDFLTLVFSHPSVTDLLMWGFWEGQHWLPDAALVRRDWTVKPAGIVWSNLVFREWTTETNIVTGSDGLATFRGFKGGYDFEVVVDGITNTFNRSGTNLVVEAPPVVLPPPSIRVQTSAEFSELLWPAAPSGYRLEITGTLNPPAWRAVDAGPVQEGDLWRFEPEPTAMTNRFFRLTRPVR